jgi:hypothetical protein
MKETIEEGDEIITTTKFSWEQERMYSEKQMDDAYDKGFKDATEKMYSEEEVKKLLSKFHIVSDGTKKFEEEWFERNKKK